jgi:hypothetical protein
LAADFIEAASTPVSPGAAYEALLAENLHERKLKKKHLHERTLKKKHLHLMPLMRLYC